ncbi:sulfite exporter TauE/SafE family protein [Emticicia fluvialis]|uniref:sulfite exporter TauE/SafE family protein n=1 Tax=Emticicia fluvialis TaxID=2974474 RepID=UPI0021664612|nr:sulfite exporter TauE/SafE family protein [Emticicia fluvialis]
MIENLEFRKIQGVVTDVKECVDVQISSFKGSVSSDTQRWLDIFIKNEYGEFFYRIHEIIPISVGHNLTMITSSRKDKNSWYVLHVMNNNLNTSYNTTNSTIRSNLRFESLGAEVAMGVIAGILVPVGIVLALIAGLSTANFFVSFLAFFVCTLPLILAIQSSSKFKNDLNGKVQNIINNKE